MVIASALYINGLQETLGTFFVFIEQIHGKLSKNQITANPRSTEETVQSSRKP